VSAVFSIVETQTRLAIKSGKRTVAYVQIGAEEHAGVIAAAPELLEALEEMTPAMPPVDASCHNGICLQAKCAHCGRIARARAAINKARTA
jgi:hypothetical protein